MDVPISLYFGVKQGDRASLDVIAKATVEWAEAVRELAAIIAPGVEIRLEFDHSEDGSVWLRNLMQAVLEGDEKALKAVAWSIIIFFALGPFLHLQADFGDAVLARLGHEHGVELSDADKQDIANRVIEAMENSNLGERRRNIIQEAEKDPLITSVGVDFEPRIGGPRVRIMRDQFPSYGAEPEQPAIAPPASDTVFEFGANVTIVRPSLREGDVHPRWRVSQNGDEWSADLEDEEFVWALRNDRTGLHLAFGQVMVVDFAIDRRLVDGEWVPHNRRIVRVVSPQIDRRQAAFDLGGPEPKKD